MRNLFSKKQDIFTKAQEEWKVIRNLDKTIIENQINNYLQTSLQPLSYLSLSSTSHLAGLNKTSSLSSMLPSAISNSINSSSFISHSVISSKETKTLYYNATAQKNSLAKQKDAEERLEKLKLLYNVVCDPKRYHDFLTQITETKQEQKKCDALENRGEVIIYDSPRRPSFLLLNPDLLEKMHSCIEFGSAAKKSRKEVIKRINSLNAKRHHHAMAIQINSVSRNEMPKHIDEHYCLQMVKDAKQFASAFASYSVIISQDDKAKVSLGILAVGRIFKNIQIAHELVEVPDHDFPKGSKQKLIPSVYLTIDLEDSNDSLHNGQLLIFIRPQWLLKTSSLTHIVDLIQIVENPDLSSKLKLEDEFKPILVLLVDNGPDENPRHLKNIKEYCKLFIELNLDYFTIRTHAPGQSAYNPVERSMSTLSEKLAGIVLPIDNFGSYLDSNDHIHGKEVFIEYVDEQIDSFNKALDISWSWIEIHYQICQYFLDIRKCNNFNCCSKWRAEEVADLLAENDRFLPPAIKGRDGHFLNPIHILQYMDKLKLLGFD
ncbi:30528_t:CDS:2 [Gigaspora margarita]|uniref:30528_t:CDS:1 n=1 Tax=Gigaspora margarita TaxID=4874 RepID=A0ABN7UQ81_GIGMA|nr:30528_t:CDS:2 [Gigaspora margarita]